MRVALDARYLNASGSGVGAYTENLLREMLAAEPDLRLLLVTRRPGLAARFGADRCEDLVFDAPPRSYRTLYRLPRLLRRHGFDLFHGPFNLLPHGTGRPTVATIHDVIPLQDPTLVARDWAFRLGAGRFWRREMAYAIRHATRVATVSETSRRAILDLFPEIPPEKVAVTPNGVDPYFAEAPSEAERAEVEALVGAGVPFVLVVGQGSPRKNHARAIAAFLDAFPEDDPMRLVLVRRLARPDAEVRALLARPEVRRRVRVLRHVERPALRALYARARAFFFPSTDEGFGLPILEAMAAGVPVVTSDRGAMAEVAGPAALLADPFDVGALAAALRRASTEEALRRGLVERGWARARAFTWRRCAEQTLAAYRAAIAAS